MLGNNIIGFLSYRYQLEAHVVLLDEWHVLCVDEVLGSSIGHE